MSQFHNTRRKSAIIEEIYSARSQLSYSTTRTQPGSAFNNAKLAQVLSGNVTNPNTEMLNYLIGKLREPHYILIPILDLPLLHVVKYYEASFANN